MEKTNFWDDAARWGALMAVVQILFSTVGLFWKSQVLSLLSLAVFITLLFVLTKRRALLYGGENGYSYGQCMKYIFWMMCFSGVLVGAWEIAARRLLFPAYYEAALEESLKMVSSLYGPAQMELAVSMARTMLFSPIWIVVLSILGSVIQGCFFGLFISAFAKREMPWPNHQDEDMQNPNNGSNE